MDISKKVFRLEISRLRLLLQIYNMERSTSGRFSQGMEPIDNDERFKNGLESLVYIYKKKTISGWQRAEIYECTG